MPQICLYDDPVNGRSGFVLNVSTYDGRSIEELLAGLRPDRVPHSMAGAILDASYAATEPDLIARLHQLDIPLLIDPQSLRFGHPQFLETKSLARLPYAPPAPLGPDVPRGDAQRLVLGALKFQDRFAPSMYVVPALPFAKPLGAEAEAYRRIHEIAAAFNGSEVQKRPLMAVAPPGTQVLRSPYALLGRLADLGFSGIYLQPLEFDAKHDSVERLASYITFARCAAEYELPVLAGRVGAFGLLLLALGIDSFDSGLMQREGFSLASLQRKRKGMSKKSGGGRRRTVYLPQVMATVSQADAQHLLRTKSLKSRFLCNMGRCRFDYQAQWVDSRSHFLHSRLHEVNTIRNAPTQEMKLEAVARLLVSCIEQADTTNRVLEAHGGPTLKSEHLRRWLAVLQRVAGRRHGWKLAS